MFRVYSEDDEDQRCLRVGENAGGGAVRRSWDTLGRPGSGDAEEEGAGGLNSLWTWQLQAVWTSPQ